ncbi:MAG: hypothetical protein ABI945_03905 [Nitrospirales bacterium]
MRTYGVHMGRTVVAGVCAIWFIMAGTVSAQGTWVEELGNFLAFYQTIHPSLDWTPYIEELTRARDGMRAGDQLTVTHAMNEFQKLLRMRAHGLDAAAAEDLYNLTLTVRTSDGHGPGMEHESGMGEGRLMSESDQRITVPYERDVRCHEGIFDYWRD